MLLHGYKKEVRNYNIEIEYFGTFRADKLQEGTKIIIDKIRGFNFYGYDDKIKKQVYNGSFNENQDLSGNGTLENYEGRSILTSNGYEYGSQTSRIEYTLTSVQRGTFVDGIFVNGTCVDGTFVDGTFVDGTFVND